MADSYGKLVDGINPTIATLTRWFFVPAGHSYQGSVRITNVGLTDATYKIAGTANAGATVAPKDYEGGNIEIKVGDIHDLTIDLGELEGLYVYADTADVTFNYRGLDIDA